jgi:hypothetical protein
MELVNVEVACPCAGTPHEKDTVGLRPKLGLRAGMLLQRFLRDSLKEGAQDEDGEIAALLTEGFLIHGVASWTFVDAEGTPIPVTDETIRDLVLSDFALAAPVADKADELYTDPVVLPLMAPASTSSPPSPTNGSTSAPNGHTQKRRTRSKPSSTSTSQTGVIATITG